MHRAEPSSLRRDTWQHQTIIPHWAYQNRVLKSANPVSALVLIMNNCIYPIGIIHPPQPANISVNDEVTLTCTAVAHHINWFINGVNVREIHDPAFGVPQTTPDNAIIDIPTYTGKLKIRGTPSTNKTLNFVVCSAIHLDENNSLTEERSKPVLVQVQGLLDAVMDLDINSSTNTMKIGWKPPFTIKGVHIDYYEVDVCKSYFYTQVNSTKFNHTLQQPSSRVANYTISVQPVNMAGVGKETRITTTVTLPSSASSLNFYTQGNKANE